MAREPDPLVTPSGSRPLTIFDFAQQGQIPLELAEAIQGAHLRAARALLDWSMPILAKSSGLSLSTVKRLEEGRNQPVSRSRMKAILALRRARIRFILLEDQSVAVARPRVDFGPNRLG